MPEIEFITADEQFHGWDTWEANLQGLPPAQVAILLSHEVRRSVESNDGQFSEIGTLNTVNFPVIMMHFLERWRQEGWAISQDSTVRMQDLEIGPRLLEALHQIGAARQGHPALSNRIVVERTLRLAQVVWYSTLEQKYNSRSAKYEIARSWLLYNVYWNRLYDEPAYPPFAAPEVLLLLSMLLQRMGPYVPDYRIALRRTRFPPESWSHLLDIVGERAEEVLDEHPVRDYPTSWFASPFSDNPLLRLGPNALFSPEPHRLFQSFEAGCHRISMKQHMAVLGEEDGYKRFSSRFGFVLEEYVQDLLRVISGEDHVFREFKYFRGNDEVDSPDFFICDTSVTVVECKAARYPYGQDDWKLASLSEWMRHATGGNENRGPFKQGIDFFNDWAAGIHDAPPWLPEHSEAARYVVVTYSDLPWVVNWPVFRERYLRPELTEEQWQHSLKCVFVSVTDLEKIAALSMGMRDATGQTVSMSEYLEQYSGALQRPLVRESPFGRNMMGGVGDFLLARHPDTEHPDPAFIHAAYEACFVGAAEFAFDQDLGETGE